MSKTRQITLMAMMLVFALMVSYIERYIPPPIPMLPGIKVGLANIVVLLLLYLWGYRYALSLNILRILLSGLLFTGVWGAVYALSGAVFSFISMALLKRSRLFGVVGVSVIGGAAHNLGQLCVAALATATGGLFYYLPVLIVSGVITGVLVGYLAGLLIQRIHKHVGTSSGA